MSKVVRQAIGSYYISNASSLPYFPSVSLPKTQFLLENQAKGFRVSLLCILSHMPNEIVDCINVLKKKARTILFMSETREKGYFSLLQNTVKIY